MLIPVVAVVMATVVGVYLTRNNRNSEANPSVPQEQPIAEEKNTTQPTYPHPVLATINTPDREPSRQDFHPKLTFTSERTWGLVCSLVVLLTIGTLVLSVTTKTPATPPHELKPANAPGNPKYVSGFSDMRKLLGHVPDVTLISKSDEKGELHGTVHNDTDEHLGMLKLSIKTAKWERKFDVSVLVNRNTTQKFTVNIGEPLFDIQSFEVLEGVVHAYFKSTK
jgi:hypothetical protein